jgi:hypothetical protein
MFILSMQASCVQEKEYMNMEIISRHSLRDHHGS